VQRVSDDFERWSYNTAVAAVMELLNTVSKWARSEHGAERKTFDEAIETMLKMLAPMSPHIVAEIWEQRFPDLPSVHEQSWPVADPALVKEETVTMVVQLNGKVRARLEVATTLSESDAEALALAAPEIARELTGSTVKRVVARPPRLVNIIV